MGTRDPRIDAYIDRAAPFAKPILTHIRDVVHSACPEAEEAVKWSMPFFVYKGSPLCNMAAFKAHASFGFWLGAQVMGDDAAEDAMGQFGRLTSVKDFPSKPVLTKHIRKAMALTDAGVKLARAGAVSGSAPSTKTAPKQAARSVALAVPTELAQALQRHPEAKATFDAFPPSQRREYAEWIAEAKRAETRERRVQQALEWLAEGKTRNWKYEAR